MNNVVAFPTEEAHSPFPNNPNLFFNVKELQAAILRPDGQAVVDPEHKYIIRQREDDPTKGTPIGLVGKGYKYFTNREFFKAIETEILQSGVDCSNVKVRDQISHGGARCKREYIFENVTIEPRVGDVVAFRLWAWNAFDGSLAWRIGGGAWRLWCSNGCASMKEHDVTVRRHSKGASIPGLTNRIAAYIDVFHQNEAVWSRWVGKHITDEQAEQVLSLIPGASDLLIKRLVNLWKEQSREDAPSVWTLYNVATYWASHNDDRVQKVRNTGNDAAAYVLYQRENRVRQWTNSSEFQQLAA